MKQCNQPPRIVRRNRSQAGVAVIGHSVVSLVRTTHDLHHSTFAAQVPLSVLVGARHASPLHSSCDAPPRVHKPYRLRFRSSSSARITDSATISAPTSAQRAISEKPILGITTLLSGHLP